jgi:hypothetical protein
MTDLEKIDRLMEHLDNVRRECVKLGKKLIQNGEYALGKQLIRNSLIHDITKFDGLEWDYLWPEFKDSQEFQLAIKQHHATNPHHPEKWGDIHNMQRVYLAETVCDWKSRSTEFGTGLMEYVENHAMKRYNFTKDDVVYKDIQYFTNLLCEKVFK